MTNYDGKTPETPNNRKEVPSQFRRGWLDELDGRLGLARDIRGRFDEIAADLGGIEALSYARRSLIERALWIEYWLAQQERELADGRLEGFDAGKYVQAVNGLQGVLAKVGLDRVARRVPSMSEFLQRREADR